MKFERFKSILLIILVISSIVLTGNKWFSEELWPGGYNFFSDVKNLFSGNGSDDTLVFNPNEEILKPAKIIINNSGNHTLFTKSSDNYAPLYTEVKDVLKLGIGAESFEKSSIEEWNNSLKSKSCYFTYPVTYDSGYFSSQLSEKYSGGYKAFKEFLVISDMRIASVMHLYIKDARSDSIQKTKISYESTVIEAMINSNSDTSGDINYYSFELNFDTEADNSVEQPIIIEPDVLISISEKTLPAVKESNTFYNISDNEELYSSILSLFEYNTSNIRKYIENDNSLVFVENYSTLKLHTNDMLDYKSVDESRGIELDTSSVYACLNSCISFVNKVTACFGLPESMYYEVSSDVDNVSSKTFTMTFDYYLNDNQIVIPDDIYYAPNAVTVEVTNGKITSYRQICKTFVPSGAEVICSSAIEAIDKIPPEANTGADISDIFLAYSYDPARYTWHPVWYIENSEGELFTIVSG